MTTIDDSTPTGTDGAESPAPSEDRAFPERVRAWTARHLDELPRFVTDPQPSLQQHLAYARHGDWHTQPDGPARRWHRAYTHLVVLPVVAVAHLLAWAVARPGRFLPLLAVAIFLATALNAVPVLGWLIPESVSATSWPPFSWLED